MASVEVNEVSSLITVVDAAMTVVVGNGCWLTVDIMAGIELKNDS